MTCAQISGELSRRFRTASRRAGKLLSIATRGAADAITGCPRYTVADVPAKYVGVIIMESRSSLMAEGFVYW